MGWVSWRFAVVTLCLVLPGVAAGADLSLPGPAAEAIVKAPEPPEWIVTIGAEFRAVPVWQGTPTTQYGFAGFPLVALQKPGEPPAFFGARDGISVSLLDLGALQIGPDGKVIFPRYASQYSQLNGLGDVPWTVQIGGYVQYWASPWLRLRGELRQGIGGETGVTGDLFMDAVVPLGQWRVSGGPRVTLESAGAISPYFGITAAQAAAANAAQPGLGALTAYNASGGLYSYGAGGQLEYFLNRQWSTHGIIEYDRISGSAANSPLVTMRGSPNQFIFGAGATYTFAMHPMW
jgi:outer membrane protein